LARGPAAVSEVHDLQDAAAAADAVVLAEGAAAHLADQPLVLAFRLCLVREAARSAALHPRPAADRAASRQRRIPGAAVHRSTGTLVLISKSSGPRPRGGSGSAPRSSSIARVRRSQTSLWGP